MQYMLVHSIDIFLYIRYRLNQLNDSVACYSKAISIDPLFIEAFIGRGNAHTEFLSTEGNQKARY